MSPKISIITINRNNASGLKETIHSVLSQKYDDREYIIIDGNSSDGSVSVIKEFESQIKYWVSEPDHGLYNAMNKGLAKARGEYVLFLNSADYFYNDQVLKSLTTGLNGEDIVYGNLCISHNENLRLIKSAPIINFHKQYQHNLPPHPATLIKRNLINEIGGFDESYNIIADVVLISKLFRSRDRSYKFIDTPVTVFDLSGVSSNSSNQNRIYLERRRLIQEEFPEYIDDFEKVYKNKSVIILLKERIKKLYDTICTKF